MPAHNQAEYFRNELRHDEVMKRVNHDMADVQGHDVEVVTSELSEYKYEEIAALIRKQFGKDVTEEEKNRWLNQIGAMVVSQVQDSLFDYINNSHAMTEWDERQAQLDARAEVTGVRPEDLR